MVFSSLRNLSLSLAAASAAGFLGITLLGASSAQAIDETFTCDSSVYQVVNNQLKIGVVDTTTSPARFSYTNIGGPNALPYNAAGFNPVDNFIYAMDIADHVLKIGRSGTVTTYGVPAGIDPSHLFPAGDVMPDGSSLIAMDYADRTIYSVSLSDLNSPTATMIGSLPAGIDVGDLAILEHEGQTTAYGFDTKSGALVSFDPSANPIAVNVNHSVTIGKASPKGAVWADSSGNLTTFVNFTGKVYSIVDPGSASPEVGLVAEGLATRNNDGMKCVLSASGFPPALPNTGTNSLDVARWAALALVLVLGGASVLLIGSRRLKNENVL